ncbi:hypothetical protein HHX47_DHR3000774 [Lentinula edodes]|nr:hypothetical protein HHX47_DHR3000774 [Lentinula edodes]
MAIEATVSTDVPLMVAISLAMFLRSTSIASSYHEATKGIRRSSGGGINVHSIWVSSRRSEWGHNSGGSKVGQDSIIDQFLSLLPCSSNLSVVYVDGCFNQFLKGASGAGCEYKTIFYSICKVIIEPVSQVFV